MIYYNESLCQIQIFHTSKRVLVNGPNENSQITAPRDYVYKDTQMHIHTYTHRLTYRDTCIHIDT